MTGVEEGQKYCSIHNSPAARAKPMSDDPCSVTACTRKVDVGQKYCPVHQSFAARWEAKLERSTLTIVVAFVVFSMVLLAALRLLKTISTGHIKGYITTYIYGMVVCFTIACIYFVMDGLGKAWRPDTLLILLERVS